jgi:hypothetical protein
MRRSPVTPSKSPGTAAERIRSIEKSNDLIGNRTRCLPDQYINVIIDDDGKHVLSLESF